MENDLMTWNDLFIDEDEAYLTQCAHQEPAQEWELETTRPMPAWMLGVLLETSEPTYIADQFPIRPEEELPF